MTLPTWPRKLVRHLRLLRHEPDTFGFNLLQWLNPQRLQDHLLDVLRPPALNLRLESALQRLPTLNVLQPTLAASVMTGGPNTVINLALALAQCGQAVRIVTNQPTHPQQLQWFQRHAANLAGLERLPHTLSVACGADARQPLAIGRADMFMATHWSSAQQLEPVLGQLQVRRFFYLIQDFEPAFYPWSSNYALALQTYDLDHIGIFNQALLRDYFVAQGVGRYAEAGQCLRSLVFEPAVDRRLFHAASRAPSTSRRRLLFYARPSNPRNLMGLGHAALRRALAHAVFREQEWEFLAIGSNNGLPPLELGAGHWLRPSSWLDYAGYAGMLRSADILLCPMLSVHTSYPVLEMAACGGLAVTTSFANKTAQRLQALCANIIAAPATEEALAHALVTAALRLRQQPREPQEAVPLQLPADWAGALAGTARQVVQRFAQERREGSMDSSTPSLRATWW